MPTRKSATARLMTKQLVTVLRRRVVMMAKMTRVLPIMVITIKTQKTAMRQTPCHDKMRSLKCDQSSEAAVEVTLTLSNIDAGAGDADDASAEDVLNPQESLNKVYDVAADTDPVEDNEEPKIKVLLMTLSSNVNGAVFS